MVPDNADIVSLVLFVHSVQLQLLLHHLEERSPNGDVSRDWLRQKKSRPTCVIVGKFPVETDHHCPAHSDRAGEHKGLPHSDMTAGRPVYVRWGHVTCFGQHIQRHAIFAAPPRISGLAVVVSTVFR